MSDLERERDFYRQQCNELGARLLRLQEEPTQARREARRSRTTARLIREIYRPTDSEAPPEELDFRHTTSLGLQLVNMLVKQLDGSIKLHRSQGTTFELTFSAK